MARNDLISMSAVALMTAIHKRELSCVEVMQAYLDRIAACNPEHNALVAIRDASQLLSEAGQKDRSLERGDVCGLLHGFPMAPKDLQPVAGMASTRGSLVFKNNIPDTDAEVVARMRAAGALFVGRSNTPEFGLGGHTYNPVYGITGNAHDPGLSAGGSSGGAGVAVAKLMLPLADGSDMMGSLRTPAAFNGIYGFRTTPGLIPNGVQDASVAPALSVGGPMARSVPDLALLLSVMADFPEKLPFMRTAQAAAFTEPLLRDFRGTRVAWLGDLNGHLAFEAGVLDACTAALPRFSATGCTVEQYVPKFDYDALWHSWIDLRSHLFYRTNAEALGVEQHFAMIKPEAQWEFLRGERLMADQVDTAKHIRSQWQALLGDVFSHYDYLLVPSAQVFPFQTAQHWPSVIDGRSMDTYHRWMEVVILASMAGAPSLSVPVGDAFVGRGAGIQIIARPDAELSVMQLGHAYDQARGSLQ
ncbi:amidase [Pusillimonas sp. T7-7]|uniref:amidase n=1 Tax=Pusillimonas sp. (strain T7-7) TaxID=1007105 RepID=UPI0002085681|nr:amidase [Pusillimonas sp. T7-7]AEC19151.1 amidase [Pusillimonas sp. T7-7]